MGGNKATVSPDQFASASTPRSASRSAPRGRAEPSPGPFTNAGPFTSPGESAALTPAQGLRAQSGLLAPARRPAPAFSSPGEAAPSRRRSLLEPFQDDTEAPPRRNDVLPGGFGGHVMSGEDSAANRRFAASLTRGGDIGAIAPIIRGAMKDNPARATVELADLSRQTHALDKQSGARLDRILDSEAKALGLPSPIAQKPAPRQVASLAPTTLNDAGGPAARTPQSPASKTAQTQKPPPQILAAAAKPGPSQTFPRPKTKPAPPSLPPIHPDFLDKLSELESKSSGGYSARTGMLPPKGTMRDKLALGKYQFQRDALIDAGYVDRDTKHWKGKDGVGSAEDFLKNPKAQENALRELSKVYWDRQLKTNGARAREGQIIDGVLNKRFTVTKSGLFAAAHREGPRRVSEYLDRLESLGWKSDKTKFGTVRQTEKFLAVETRLRQFSTIPFNK